MTNSNSFSTGGIAEYYTEPRSTSELEAVLETAYKKNADVTVIGGGTHILIPDEGIAGLVISTKAMKGLTIKGNLITAAPGELFDNIINIAIDHNLIGMEELGGIPGTVAGAVKVNASANGKSLSDFFFYADTMTLDGRRHRHPLFAGTFSYQESIFSKDEIIISVGLRLQPAKATAESRLRKERFVELFFIPPCARFSGQIFRDPYRGKAADLIKECGLAGENGSRAEFSRYQPNSIFTYPGCSSDEIKALIMKAEAEILRKTGIALKPSITIL